MTVVSLDNPSPGDIAIANGLVAPVIGCHAGRGIHVTIPDDWQARCMAGEWIAGCTSTAKDRYYANILISDLQQSRWSNPTYTAGLNATWLANFISKVTGASPVIRLVMAGDSITAGLDVSFPQLRIMVNDNLLAREYNVIWLNVGVITNGPYPVKDSQAVGGNTVAQGTAYIAPYYGVGKIRSTVWRVMYGANNVTSPASFNADYAAELAAIQTAEPASCVSVGLVTPTTIPAYQAITDTFNAALPGIVATAFAGGQDVILEASAGLVVPGDLIDHVHPNAAGNLKISVVAANGIVAACQLAGYLPP